MLRMQGFCVWWPSDVVSEHSARLIAMECPGLMVYLGNSTAWPAPRSATPRTLPEHLNLLWGCISSGRELATPIWQRWGLVLQAVAPLGADGSWCLIRRPWAASEPIVESGISSGYI